MDKEQSLAFSEQSGGNVTKWASTGLSTVKDLRQAYEPLSLPAGNQLLMGLGGEAVMVFNCGTHSCLH